MRTRRAGTRGHGAQERAFAHPTNSLTLVGFRYYIVRNKFPALRLRKTLFNGRTGFSIKMHNRSFLARQRE
jgi:hypothetical protein